ncbi:hypothetical protein Y1Q_0004271 [Alligator mississippiensis]|uniref:Uncharacterized protein n=1 Tax=Alligator mississippiensis TaxID=8496 RepID=A0A151MI93_ALLMI|nr:hypothetical protein Y1Q_0004271 [Alligator mississippiensis]
MTWENGEKHRFLILMDNMQILHFFKEFQPARNRRSRRRHSGSGYQAAWKAGPAASMVQQLFQLAWHPSYT